MSECRECKETISWVRTPNGKMMPVQLDAEGELVLIDEGDTHRTCRVRKPDLIAEHATLERYTAHADFCSR